MFHFAVFFRETWSQIYITHFIMGDYSIMIPSSFVSPIWVMSAYVGFWTKSVFDCVFKKTSFHISNKIRKIFEGKNVKFRRVSSAALIIALTSGSHGLTVCFINMKLLIWCVMFDFPPGNEVWLSSESQGCHTARVFVRRKKLKDLSLRHLNCIFGWKKRKIIQLFEQRFSSISKSGGKCWQQRAA